ncbi:MAG: AtpZ/AtpI family protein [Deltaproteobacteria bacterium]|jgi:ATP synthase protein I
MDERHPSGERQTDVRKELVRKLRAKEARKIRARHQKDGSVWFGLGMFGLVGWSVAIPTILGVALGVWIDLKWTSRYSWTLMLLIIGIGVGCLNAWFWVSRERKIIEEEIEKLESK